MGTTARWWWGSWSMAFTGAVSHPTLASVHACVSASADSFVKEIRKGYEQAEGGRRPLLSTWLFYGTSKEFSKHVHILLLFKIEGQ